MYLLPIITPLSKVNPITEDPVMIGLIVFVIGS